MAPENTSTVPIPDATSAAIDEAVKAVADAVRNSFTPFSGSDVDPTTGEAVVAAAARRASKAAHDALSTALASFLSTTSSSATSTSDGAPRIPASTAPATTVPASTAPSSVPPGAPSIPPALEQLFAAARLATGLGACGNYDDMAPHLPGFPGDFIPIAPTRPAAPPLNNEARNALHTQAVGVLNVKALVPVTLDVGAANFTRWRGLFLVALGKYALTNHVISDNYFPDRADWLQMDCVVLGWLYSSISADLLQEVMTHVATARSVWRALELQFLGNSERRALTLETEFRTLHQGDLSITDYCRKMKAMADTLGDLGYPVRDRSLVLATLNGLNCKYDHMQTLITMQRPFPSFADMRSQLLLEELSKAGRPTSSSTVLLAGASKPANNVNLAYSTRFGAGNQGGGNGSTGGGNGNSRNRRRRGGCGGGSGNNGGNTGASVGTNQGGTAPRPPWNQVGAWPTPHNP